MISVQCPSCRRFHLLPESVLGKKAQCNACQHVFVVAHDVGLAEVAVGRAIASPTPQPTWPSIQESTRSPQIGGQTRLPGRESLSDGMKLMVIAIPGGLFILAAAIAVAFVLRPTSTETRTFTDPAERSVTAHISANRVKCASNLRQIGQGCLRYANDHKYKYPSDMGLLLKEDEMHPELFVCPSGKNKLPADIRNAPVDQQAKWVVEHADYVYLGGKMNCGMPVDFVLAFEKPESHENEGMNVLFNDGHVEWISAEGAKKGFEELMAGRNPPAWR